MLFRLMLVLLVVAGAAWLWWRLKKPTAGGLNVLELREILQLAKGSQRLEAAVLLRVNIVEAATAEEKASMTQRVDDVVRRLARQENLHQKIKGVLAENDPDNLIRAQDELRGRLARTPGPEEKVILEDKLAALHTQEEQLGRLKKRLSELDDAADRAVLELKNLHLALLEASSVEAAASGDRVTSALGHLEEASESLRQKAQADDEVDRLLRAARGRHTQRT